MIDKKKLIKICEMIRDDMKSDSINFDGKLFNGKVVAEYFGNQGAAIATLSDIVKEIIENK